MKHNIWEIISDKKILGRAMKILISQERQRRGISGLKLSKMTGIPKSTLHEIESGKCSPRLDQLEKIAIALNCSINSLFDSAYK